LESELQDKNNLSLSQTHTQGSQPNEYVIHDVIHLILRHNR